MSRVVKNNRGLLQLLADCPHQQRQFLLKRAHPQQAHALVQIIQNVFYENIPMHKENDALVNLAETDIPYQTKKQTLAQEGGGFIQDLLTPVISSLGFLMLKKQGLIILKVDHLYLNVNER